MAKRTLLLLVISLFLLIGMADAGQNILIIQSLKVKPYEEAGKGFKSVCNFQTKKLIVSGLDQKEVLRKINASSPDVIVSIGFNALSKVRNVKNIPIIYLMVLNPQSILSGAENITGVRMNVPLKKQLTEVKQILPDVKNIGFLYNRDRTGYLVERAQVAAKKIDVNLVATEVQTSKDVPSYLKAMEGKIDVFWMLPDITVVTPETVEFLLLFSFENKIPIITFSEKYVELGALVSIGSDPYDMGVQAGKMAQKILSGVSVKDVKPVDARNALISINTKIARKLEINIDEKIIKGFKVVN